MGLFDVYKKKPAAKNTFVCDICKKEFFTKYRHSGNICVECAETRREKITQQSASVPKSVKAIRELVISECYQPSYVGEQAFGFSLIQSDASWYLLVKWSFAKPGSYTQYKEERISLPDDIFEVYNTMELLCGYLYSISPRGSYFPKGYGNWKDRDIIEQLLVPTATQYCSDNSHSFTKLTHRNNGAECFCQKCGLIQQFTNFNKKEVDAFLVKYRGSDFDFYIPTAVGFFEHRYNEIEDIIKQRRLLNHIRFGMNLKALNYVTHNRKPRKISAYLMFDNGTYTLIRKMDGETLSEENFPDENSAFNTFTDCLIDDSDYTL